METSTRTTIRIETTINASLEKVWEFWTNPIHILHWNNASSDWFTPYAENDLRVGGKCFSRMEARDGSFGFDFNGTYEVIEPLQKIVYFIEDGRRVEILFSSENDKTRVIESFEAEETNSEEMQREGWNAILNNFKNYVEKPDFELMHFEIEINAPVEKVYQTMIDVKGYNQWTSVFNPSSRFEGSWQKGSKILFIGVDESGEKGGMVSYIRENRPNRFISIEHLGMIKGNEEITSGPEIQAWAGALENYSFVHNNGKTLVIVNVDSNQEFKNYFESTWPLALNKLKEICEQ